MWSQAALSPGFGEISAIRSHSCAFFRYSSRSFTGMLPTRRLLGPGLGLLDFIDESDEAVRNCPRNGLVVVLSQPPPDFGADLFP
jgi:hypothetical protein